ncbi:MAG: hypothetical protein U1D55_01315 [Phycisphaerae bacterium]
MSIQFPCAGCGQPIEVDEIHAGAQAACPYCRRVMAVPSASTLASDVIQARGAEPTETPMNAKARASARGWGNASLACAMVALGCVVFQAAIGVGVALDLSRKSEQRPTQEEMMKSLAESSWYPYMMTTTILAALCALMALLLGIASVAQRANIRGYLGLAIGAAMMLLMCGSLIATAAMRV